MKFRFIVKHRHEFSLSRMCRVLGVSKSGIFAWLNRGESPLKRLVCAMRLLSPLAHKWDAGRSAYSKAKLEEMAQAMGMAFTDAHDAAADVKMTIAMLRWAYAEAHKRARV